MTCADVQLRISAYRDGELGPAEGELVVSHLAECPECREYLEDVTAIGELLRSDPACEVPAGLWGRIAKAAEKTGPRRRLSLQGWLSRAAAVAAGFVVYFFGHDLMVSTLQPDRPYSVSEAAQIERVLHETGQTLAGGGPVGGRPGLLAHRSETRLLAELFKEVSP